MSKKQRSLRGDWALVTGASSGIGWALAEQLAQAGCHLIVTARSEERLQQLAQRCVAEHGIRVEVIAADLSQAGEVERLVQELGARGLQVDHLFNNAGLGQVGRLAESQVEGLLRVLDVNCRALTELTARLAPAWLQRNYGGVVFLASLLAFYPCPGMAAYAASKAYVMHLGEALAVEWEGTALRVCVVYPGQVLTGFQAAAGFAPDAAALPGQWTAEAVAGRAIQGYLRGSREVVPGAPQKLSRFFAALVPRRWAARGAYVLLRRSGRFGNTP